MTAATTWAALRTVARNLRNARHEPEVPFMRALLRPDDICLHVGASDGRHSYVMSDAIGDAGHIYAFEPSSYSFDVLRRACRLHGLRNITLEHAAVSDTEGELTLNTPIKRSGRPGRSFAFVSRQAGPMRGDIAHLGGAAETVRCVTVDDYVQRSGIERVDFIRCDVEGAEIGVLRGAADTLDRFLPWLLLEIHPDILREQFASSAEEIVELLTARSYRMFGLDGDQLFETRQVAADLPWKDYFFIHPSHGAARQPGPFAQFFS
ncbi:MAG: FkbM family methyltransferase [Gammaproteobacteria bacterium]|nr:FkbM family methyltransferase [Gammaproteobacteria bacterium]NNL99419.1 FkbM family methyltransferase [Gammaproteobacteria bacterium]